MTLPRLDSLEDIRRYENGVKRQRIKRKPEMLEPVEVYYGGGGERWLWGTLGPTTAIARRPRVVFEYSAEAKPG